jgi:serine/threonine-protein kinase HipA
MTKELCKGCLRPDVAGYCTYCRGQLFSKARIGSVLPFDLAERSQLSILSSYGTDKRLQDIRIEYPVQQNGTVLALADGNGSHILKPIPTGTQQRLGQIPANEHLTMQLAAQVYNIYTVPNALIFEATGRPAYITRRFDLAQSSFYTNKITLRELAGDEQGKLSSVEDIAGLLKKYIAAYTPQVEHLYALSIFNFLFSNYSQILYQLSLIETSQGEYLLSPAYNLLCTELHEHGDSAGLFTDSPTNAGGSFAEFLSLASKIGIVAKRAERILGRFIDGELLIDYMVRHSFLDEDGKQIFLRLYKERLEKLRVR